MNDGGARVEGVSRVVRYIARLISENKNLSGIAVRGEVSALAYKNGRMYFDLKENADILKCVVWSNTVPKLPPFQAGAEVIVGGNFKTFAPQSVYQLEVTSLELSGVGRLYAQFEALKARFRSEGLFDAARKRPMPKFPSRVALVSARGKGAEDFLTTLERRAPNVGVAFVETRVQGDGAQIEIADAIDRAARMDVDVIVIARGGGSYEDLFAFNLEPVVRAIVRSKRPVLTAIGHTGDRHLADEAADRVADTPSNAAHYFGELRDERLRTLETLARRLEASVNATLRTYVQRYDTASERLDRNAAAIVPARRNRLFAAERRLVAQTPSAQLAARARRLSALAARLHTAGPRPVEMKLRRLETFRDRLERARSDAFRALDARTRLLEARLDRFDPAAPLKLGYALVYSGGTLLRDASSALPGSQIEARLQRGTLRARVEGTMNDD